MRRPLSSLLLLAGLVAAIPQAMAESDPHLRAAQFDQAMGRPFEALVNLLADQRLSHIQRQPAEAEQQLAELYLHYGAHQRAAELLQASSGVQDQAWFLLAREQYRRGLDEEALASLGRISVPLAEPLQQERLLMAGALNLRTGQLAAAEEPLRQLANFRDGSPSWVDPGRFNLAVALYRLGREDEARAELRSLGQLSGKDAESGALRDKANLTLAYADLKAGRFGDAESYFKRARLDGPLSNTALLGLGRLYADQEQYKKALVPWLELSKRDPSEQTVQDALLAVPYAFGKLEAFKQALEYYRRAMDVFQQEVGRLQQVQAQVESGAAVTALAEALAGEAVGQRSALTALPEESGAVFLRALYSTREFQETLKHFTQLQFALQRQAQWRTELQANTKLTAQQREALLARCDALASDLKLMSDKLRSYLQTLALDELERRRKRLLGYADEARFSIARIYDYAAKRWGGK